MSKIASVVGRFCNKCILFKFVTWGGPCYVAITEIGID